MGTAHSLPSSFLSSLRHTVLEWLFLLSKEFVLSNSFYKGSEYWVCLSQEGHGSEVKMPGG